jgi:L-phenylalanine/L-methionine N-acetyltransferase
MTDLTIRAFELDDWPDVAELFLAPKCQWGTLQLPYQSRDDIKKKLENPPENFHRLVAIGGEGQRAVGMLGLHLGHGRRAHSGEIGMTVHDDYQDQGIGSKLLAAAIDLAENWLNLTRIELKVYVDNPSAVRLYEKFGFVKEGTFRKFAYRDGRYVDAHAMARIRE